MSLFAFPIYFLILCFSPGVAGPNPPRRSSHRHRIGECSRARLQDIPNRIREVAGHGVRPGTVVALATAQFETSHDLLQVEPVHFPLGSKDWWAFEELADDMEMAAAAITEDVSIEAIIGNVFADD